MRTILGSARTIYNREKDEWIFNSLNYYIFLVYNKDRYSVGRCGLKTTKKVIITQN